VAAYIQNYHALKSYGKTRNENLHDEKEMEKKLGSHQPTHFNLHGTMIIPKPRHAILALPSGLKHED
jgi:hypothetical protein